MNVWNTSPHTTEREGLGRRALHGAMWSAVNTMVMKVANIAIMVVVVRLVTPEDFGVFAVALVVHAVVSSVGELGLSSCISRRDLDPDKVAPTVSLLALVSSLILAVLMALTAEPIATALGSSGATDPVRVLSVSVFLGGVFTVPGALLVREFRQGRIFLANAASFVPMNLLLVLLAAGGNGAMAFAWSRVAGQAISGIVMSASVGRLYWPRLDPVHVLPVLRFGLPLAGANLLTYVLLNADYAIIGSSLGPEHLGIYMLAFTVASWSTSILSSTINSVAMPAFSAVGSNPQKLRALLALAGRLVALVALPIGAITMTLAGPLVDVLYGVTWRASAPVLAVLAIYGCLFSLSLLLSNLLVGTGRSKVVLVVQGISIAALVPSVSLGISAAGLVGAAYAHLAVIVAVVFPCYLLALRSSVPAAASVFVKSVIAPFAAALAVSTVATCASAAVDGSGARLIIGCVAGGAVYAPLAFFLLRPFLSGLRVRGDSVPGTRIESGSAAEVTDRK
ncbi:MAG: Polysaccharide biosynthesis family protein [Pseudarthrobacter sp.]|nr:Polysaccharide biosynthesis family protein [Pseudarthrobacter sp.]